MAQPINVENVRKSIQRWQASLRFAQTEADKQAKNALVKMIDADESHGFINMSIGNPERKFKLFCNENLLIQTEEPELMDWSMHMNEVYDDKQSDAKYDGGAAMRDGAIYYTKHNKVVPVADEEVPSDEEAEQPGYVDYDSDSPIRETERLRMPTGDATREKQMTAHIEKEFRKLNAPTLREQHGIHVMPNKDDPMSWKITMFNFDESTGLAGDLDKYRQQFAISDLLFEIHFTADFPLDPPDLRCVRPRLQPGTGFISNGGKCVIPELTRQKWLPGFELRDILVKVKAGLLHKSAPARLEMRARHQYPKYADLHSVLSEQAGPGQLVMSLKCYEPMQCGRMELEQGNIVLLPEDVRGKLEAKGVAWPFYVRISARNSSVYSVCAVPKFDGPSDMIICPVWLMQNLGIDNAEEATIASVQVPLAEYVQFQPQTLDFAKDLDHTDSALAIIAASLENFFTLSKDDVIPVQFKQKTYWLAVTQTKPARSICIHPPDRDATLDLKMDLLPAAERVTTAARATLTPLQFLPHLERRKSLARRTSTSGSKPMCALAGCREPANEGYAHCSREHALKDSQAPPAPAPSPQRQPQQQARHTGDGPAVIPSDVDAAVVRQLMDMGFPQRQAVNAVRTIGADVMTAADYCLQGGGMDSDEDAPAVPVAAAVKPSRSKPSQSPGKEKKCAVM